MACLTFVCLDDKKEGKPNVTSLSKYIKTQQQTHKISAIFDGREYDTKTRRCLLYNRIVEMLPENMVQPKGNLSDFVLV